MPFIKSHYKHVILAVVVYTVVLLVKSELRDSFFVQPHKAVSENGLLSSIILSRETTLPINHVTFGEL